MRRIGWVLLLGLASMASFPSSATIYKCKGSDGEPVYQDMPCANTGLTERVYNFNDDTPSGHTPQRNTTPTTARGTTTYVGTRPQTPAPAQTRPAPTESSDQHVGGLGVSAYARGDIHAVRCTTANGKVYYAKGSCGTTVVSKTVHGRDWQDDSVDGMPDAVMVGPDEALNPRTGQVVELEDVPDTTTVSVVTRDHAQSVSPDEACDAVQSAEAKDPYSKKLTRKDITLCQQDRSLYNQTRSHGSLYYRAGQ